MSAFLAAFLVHSFKAAVVVVLVLVVQRLFRRWLPARFVYALWALVLLRLLIPVPPLSSWSLFRLPADMSSRLPGLIALPATPPATPRAMAKPSLWERACEERAVYSLSSFG